MDEKKPTSEQTNSSEQSVAPVAQQPAAPIAPAAGASNGFAIASLVLGIIAFLFGWIGFFNLLVAILAVVFGILALVKHQHKGFGLAGLILGALGLITSVIVGIFFSALMFSGFSERGYTNNTSTQSQTADQQMDTPKSSWDVNTAYDKVQTGMTKAEVEEATGKKPENCTSSESQYGKYESCYYGSVIDDNGSLTVGYTDGKVSSKSKYNSSDK